jgi:hypothetical protein
LTFHLLLVYLPFVPPKTEDIAVSFAGQTSRGKIPKWAKRFKVRSTTLHELSQQESLSGILVVENADWNWERLREHVSLLASAILKSSDPVRLVWKFPSRPDEPAALTDILRLFRESLSSRVDVALGNEDLKGSFVKALANYQLDSEDTKNDPQPREIIAATRPLLTESGRLSAKGAASIVKALGKYQIESEQTKNDPLSQAREVIDVTRPLLTESGRLSAKAVASIFGIPWTRFANQIGSTKQAVGKTPDSAALQPALRPFERVARLRAILKDADFRAWLNRANVHLDNQTPLELIESGRVEIVADLVESMLTGTPS